MDSRARSWIGVLVAWAMVVGVMGSSLQSPPYSVVHGESDFEIRLYRPTAWVTSAVDDISFTEATQLGFHRLFQYIQGANLNNSRVPMTKPVLTGIIPSAGPFCSSAFACVAVRAFSGFAKDSNVAKEAALLEASLKTTPWADITEDEPEEGQDAYTIAQYNSPFKILGRVNEVWVSTTSADDCHSASFKSKAGSGRLAEA